MNLRDALRWSIWTTPDPKPARFRMSPSEAAADLARYAGEKRRVEATKRRKHMLAMLRYEVAAGVVSPIRPREVVIAEARKRSR